MVEDVYEKVKDILHSVWHREMSADEGMDELTCVVDLFPAQWQDISTAPKERHVVMGWDCSWSVPYTMIWDKKQNKWLEYIELEEVNPTHWMYLPPKPFL